MADVKICACGIAADDCDYHRPAAIHDNACSGNVLRIIEGTTIEWVSPPDPNVTIVLPPVITINPFFTNDMTKRAEYMRANPDTWPSAVRDAGLLAPWELHKA